MTPLASSSASRSSGREEEPLLLLDANILLKATRPGFPWKEEIARLLGSPRVAVPASVLREVDRLAARGVRQARPALAIAQDYPTIPAPGDGDDAILGLAIRRRATVLTADRALAERLRAVGLDVVVPRDRARLELRRAPILHPHASSARATVKKRSRLGNLIGGRPRRHARR